LRTKVWSLRGVLLAITGGLVALGVAVALLQRAPASGATADKSPPVPAAVVTAKKGVRVPQFTLDPTWPKPLPNNWAYGGAAWVNADPDHDMWLLHRPLQLSAADVAAGKIGAPPVLEFDRSGNVKRAWGGPAWLQPWFTGSFGQTGTYPADTPPEHGLYVDSDRNVWVTGHGSVVYKFAPNGRLLLTIGKFDQTGGSNNTELLGNPTDMVVDSRGNEVYVADGYLNRRVIVFDAETGAYKRHWGAYGNVPDDGPPELFVPGQPPPRQFFVVHCIDLSRDGLVYVCDRHRNRIQVFRRDGTFVDELIHTPEAPAGGGITVMGPFGRPDVSAAGFGSGNSLAFSPNQRYLYLSAPPGIKIIERKTLRVIGGFPVTASAHGIATNAQGNIYLAGRQRYLLTGYSR
jgi:hypothetical protein